MVESNDIRTPVHFRRAKTVDIADSSHRPGRHKRRNFRGLARRYARIRELRNRRWVHQSRLAPGESALARRFADVHKLLDEDVLHVYNLCFKVGVRRRESRLRPGSFQSVLAQ